MKSTGSYQLSGTYRVSLLNRNKTSKDREISFEISEANQSIKGTTSCNSFFGAITTEGNSFRITELNISENYCDDEVLKTEQSLMRAFNSVASYLLKKETLSFFSDPDHGLILKAVKDTIQ
jgi:heat shock protein HslJ